MNHTQWCVHEIGDASSAPVATTDTAANCAPDAYKRRASTSATTTTTTMSVHTTGEDGWTCRVSRAVMARIDWFPAYVTLPVRAGSSMYSVQNRQPAAGRTARPAAM